VRAGRVRRLLVAATDPDAAATARYVAAHARVRVLTAAPGASALVA
jgi:hypothetical protein